MHIVCLDLEGVLVPEIWIAFSEATGISELSLTTRDISDYDVLMKRRLAILREHDLKLDDIREVIGRLEPLPGAGEFLANLRRRTQVIILSDTYVEFANPLMRKLAWPSLFCNSLVVNDDGIISGYRLRQRDGKRRAVEAFQSLGFSVIAAGDSYNDISMLSQAEAGVLFKAPEAILKEYPQFSSATTHPELLERILDSMDSVAVG